MATPSRPAVRSGAPRPIGSRWKIVGRPTSQRALSPLFSSAGHAPCLSCHGQAWPAPVCPHEGVHVRKVTAGVVSLVLASGAGAAFGIAPATAAPPVNPPAASAVRPSDELPNALESKRR